MLAVIFSKDRPMQLDATLRSFMLHCLDFNRVSIRIIVKASNELCGQAYQLLVKEYSSYTNITLIAEADFQQQILHLLKSDVYILWLVDDNIFVRKFSLTDCQHLLEINQDAVGYSLRLGENTTYCYSLDKHHAVPDFKKISRTTYKYKWSTAEYDFGYPLEVSSSLYRTRDLMPLFESINFFNPNSLEGEMASRASYFKEAVPWLLCPIKSITFCNPINKVQSTAGENRAGESTELSSKSLLDSFLRGERIDVATFDGFIPNACHQEVALTFINSKPASPKVSVIVPCYNQAHFLAEAVESVVKQTFTDWECLIVNDGSPDNSTEVVRGLIELYPDKRIRLLEKLNGGLADARNYGIERASGTYILPLDSDDVLHPEILKRTVEFLESHPRIAIVYTDLIHFGADQKHVIAAEYDFHSLKYANQLNYCSLYRREVWEKVGGYNTNMTWGYEDWDFWIGVGKRGYVAQHLPEALLFYRVKSESMFTKALEHDAELKAQIVMNHAQLYNEQERLWALEVLGKLETPLPLVSVIVPTHNRPDMLKDAIQSILNQTFQNYEIIVVNDAGQDVSSVVQAFNSPKIYCLSHETNKGLAAARNTGIHAAKGRYIAYLDDDDIFCINHLEVLVTFLENADFYVAYTDSYRVIQELHNGRYVTIKRETSYSYDFDYGKILIENFIPVLCVMHRRECLEKSGYFDETLDRHEDWDLWIRMSRHYKFAHIPKITCEYTYRSDGSGMTSGSLPKFLWTMQRIYKKYEFVVPADSVIEQQKRRSLFNIFCSVFNFIGDRLNTFLPIDELPYQELFVAGATTSQVRSGYYWKKAEHCSDQEEAITFFEKAISEDVHNHPAKVALVLKYIEIGKFTEAISLLATLVELNPLEPIYSITLKNLEETCNQEREHSSRGKRFVEPLTDQPIKVSIIIPVFNQLPFTRQCLDGLFATLPAAISSEIIVVDNGSSDGTGEYLHSLADQVMMLSNSENTGFAEACNQGARAACGELILFLNNDTIPKSGWLEALIAPIVSDEANICGARLLYPDGRCQHAGIAFYERGLSYHIFGGFPGDSAPVMERRFMQAVTGACMALRKSLFQELGGFDEGFRNGFEDVDLCLRAGEKGLRILYVPDSILVHYAEQSSGRKDNDITNMQRFFARWQGKVRHDDKVLYTRFDLTSLRGADGRITVSPAINGAVVVSIIIPLYNQVELTRACLKALERNTAGVRYELVLVDNGSSDGTAGLLALWENKATVVRNINNQGFAAACNQGAIAAKGNYLLFLNNDTEPLAGWLGPLLDVFSDKENVGIVGNKLLYPDGTIQHAGVVIVKDDLLNIPVSPCHLDQHSDNEPGADQLRLISAVTGACMMVAKPVFETVGGFDESYWNGYEDVDLCFKVQKAGFAIYYQPASVVIHHESKSGQERQVRENDNLRLLQKRWEKRITPDLILLTDNKVLHYDFASIIILTYNSENTILGCLDSVKNTVRPYDEVIIVDNGSKDRTVAIVEHFVNGLRQFRLIKNGRNLGFSAGTNAGISNSANPYVMLLNPDTIVTAGWLDKLYAHFYLSGHTTGAVGPISNYVAGLQKMELYQQEQIPANATIENVAKIFSLWNNGKRMESKLLIGFCMMIRRTVLHELGMLDEKLFLGNDDLELSWRLRANSYRLFVATDTFVYHEGQQSFNTEPSGTTKRLVQESTDALYDKLSKHYGAGNIPVPTELWGIEWFTPTTPRFNNASRFMELKIVPGINTEYSTVKNGDPSMHMSIPLPNAIQPVAQEVGNVRYPLIPLVWHSASSILQKLSSSQRLKGVLKRYTNED